jgi:hypothetical protein
MLRAWEYGVGVRVGVGSTSAYRVLARDVPAQRTEGWVAVDPLVHLRLQVAANVLRRRDLALPAREQAARRRVEGAERDRVPNED